VTEGAIERGVLATGQPAAVFASGAGCATPWLGGPLGPRARGERTGLQKSQGDGPVGDARQGGTPTSPAFNDPVVASPRQTDRSDRLA
jgi:hypothetical protein